MSVMNVWEAVGLLCLPPVSMSQSRPRTKGLRRTRAGGEQLDSSFYSTLRIPIAPQPCVDLTCALPFHHSLFSSLRFSSLLHHLTFGKMTTPDRLGAPEDLGVVELFGTSSSTFTRSIALGLHELGIPFIAIERAAHSADIKSRNPYGTVPIL